jgi:hypothetical protein
MESCVFEFHSDFRQELTSVAFEFRTWQNTPVAVYAPMLRENVNRFNKPVPEELRISMRTSIGGGVPKPESAVKIYASVTWRAAEAWYLAGKIQIRNGINTPDTKCSLRGYQMQNADRTGNKLTRCFSSQNLT